MYEINLNALLIFTLFLYPFYTNTAIITELENSANDAPDVYGKVYNRDLIQVRKARVDPWAIGFGFLSSFCLLLFTQGRHEWQNRILSPNIQSRLIEKDTTEQVADYILLNITLIKPSAKSTASNNRSLKFGNWEKVPEEQSEPKLELSKTIGSTEIRNLDAVFKAIRERRSEFKAIFKAKLEELKASGYFHKNLRQDTCDLYLSLLIDCRIAGEMINFLRRKDVFKNVEWHRFRGANALEQIDKIAAVMPQVCFDTDKSPLYCHNKELVDSGPSKTEDATANNNDNITADTNLREADQRTEQINKEIVYFLQIASYEQYTPAYNLSKKRHLGVEKDTKPTKSAEGDSSWLSLRTSMLRN